MKITRTQIPPAIKGALLSAINNPDTREFLQKELREDHLSVIRRFQNKYGLRTGSIRQYLKSSGYDVPSRKSPKPLPLTTVEPVTYAPPGTFLEELQALINRHSMENGSNTPDFILAEYLESALKAFNAATTHRDTWYGRTPNIVEVPTQP